MAKNKSGQSLRCFVVCFAVSAAYRISRWGFYLPFIMGNPANFVGAKPKSHPLPGNFLGVL